MKEGESNFMGELLNKAVIEEFWWCLVLEHIGLGIISVFFFGFLLGLRDNLQLLLNFKRKELQE